jgi:hypothetical protein
MDRGANKRKTVIPVSIGFTIKKKSVRNINLQNCNAIIKGQPKPQPTQINHKHPSRINSKRHTNQLKQILKKEKTVECAPKRRLYFFKVAPFQNDTLRTRAHKTRQEQAKHKTNHADVRSGIMDWYSKYFLLPTTSSRPVKSDTYSPTRSDTGTGPDPGRPRSATTNRHHPDHSRTVRTN